MHGMSPPQKGSLTVIYNSIPFHHPMGNKAEILTIAILGKNKFFVILGGRNFCGILEGKKF